MKAGWKFKSYANKRSALWACAMLWQWLAANPLSRKGEWPGWDLIPEATSHCPSCAYTKSDMNSGCWECPTREAWGGGSGPMTLRCLYGKDSHYSHWKDAMYHGEEAKARYHARAIYEVAKQELLKVVGQ